MDMGWTKRPDCDGCGKTEGGFIVLGRSALCYPCSKKYKAKAILNLIKDNLSKEEIKAALGGE